MEYDSFMFSDEAITVAIDMYAEIKKIEFIVEDRDKEYLYEDIFQELFSDLELTILIRGVGGKKAVEQEFLTRHDAPEFSDVYYLFDLDFDTILGNKIIEHTKVIYLERYEIENYFLSEDSMISYAKYRLKKQARHVQSIISYQEWYDKVVNDLLELFQLFMLVQKHNLPIKNTGLNADRFIDNSGKARTDEIVKYKTIISNKLLEEKIEINIEDELAIILRQIDTITKNRRDYAIKGKYIVCAARKYLTNIFKKCDAPFCSISESDFEGHLISNLEYSHMQFIKERIVAEFRA